MAPKQKRDETGELMVSIDQYTRTRDQVILALTNLQTGLTHVQTGLNDLLRAYMQHTSSILAGEDGDLDKLQLPASIIATANATMEAATSAANGMNQAVNASIPVDGAVADGKNKKRKREKKEKDPNAPKKPLTAAFLYAQTARPIVRTDLEAALGDGEALEKNAVNLEVTKRWNALSEEEKEEWKQLYRNKMVQWRVEMDEYTAKTGEKAAEIHLDDDASDMGEALIEAEAGAIDSDVSSEDEDEAPVIKAPSPPAKTPRPNKRQKTAPIPAVNGSFVPITPAIAGSTPVPVPGSMRLATQVPAPNSSIEAPATTKKERKKKEKAGSAAPQPIAPAPAPSHKELTPEEGSKTSKKAKTGRSTRTTEVEVDKENALTPSQKKEEKKSRERSKRKSEVTST